MKHTLIHLIIISVLAVTLPSCSKEDKDSRELNPDSAVAVSKTNSVKIYMHYMPWFQTKEYSGYWGSHWRMKNMNPEVVDENGIRQIASHYYPLIGPYDSKDPDVIEYHLLLMKYAGVDGVLFDWYGSHTLYDYKENFKGCNAVIDHLSGVGLGYAMVYEEYTAGEIDKQTSKSAINAAREDMQYLEKNCFNKDNYIKVDDKPLLLTFGPRYFKLPSQWDEIFQVFTSKPAFLPLWDHTAFTGTTDSGEFSWVDFDPDLKALSGFYNKSLSDKILVGSAFPRFHDFYEQGGTGTSYGFVDAANGDTFRNTLKMASDRQAEHLQLVTWNDFGEGTVIEPTLQDGFLFLEILQEFTGVSYTKADLEMIHEYYLKRKKYKGKEEEEKILDQIFLNLIKLQVSSAKDLLTTLP
jgi:glycoprotein endo-alpha-1,2-mannosidase